MTEISPKVFRVSADYQATKVTLDQLETSLAGVMLLVEHDGRYRRLWTWLRKYGLRKNLYRTIYLSGNWPPSFRFGHGYILAGCSPEIHIDKSVLEDRWSGRLVIQGYEKQYLLLWKYLWYDIQKSARGMLKCRV